MEYLHQHNSNTIKWARYDAKNKLLHVEFVGKDDEYEYKKVPLKKWKELKEAESKGTYINQRIKPFHEYNKSAPGLLRR